MILKMKLMVLSHSIFTSLYVRETAFRQHAQIKMVTLLIVDQYLADGSHPFPFHV